jgi:hypothetical protein
LRTSFEIDDEPEDGTEDRYGDDDLPDRQRDATNEFIHLPPPGLRTRPPPRTDRRAWAEINQAAII